MTPAHSSARSAKQVGAFAALCALSSGCGLDALGPMTQQWCFDYATCSDFLTTETSCPEEPVEVCDGVDNDCDGVADDWDAATAQPCGGIDAPAGDAPPEDPPPVEPPPAEECQGIVAGAPCNVGVACGAGVIACISGTVVCEPYAAPDDFDRDGIPDATDSDDDEDGLLDHQDEFPRGLVIDERIIDFDYDPYGNPLAAGATLAEQYAAWGVHLRSGYHVARRVSGPFGCYNGTSTLNVLCTSTGASGGMCEGPANDELVIDLDAPLGFASIEMRTRCDDRDGDSGTLRAYDAGGGLVAEDQQIGQTDVSPWNEGLAIPAVHGEGIRSLRIHPGDFDSIDTLRLVYLAGRCR